MVVASVRPLLNCAIILGVLLNIGNSYTMIRSSFFKKFNGLMNRDLSGVSTYIRTQTTLMERRRLFSLGTEKRKINNTIAKTTTKTTTKTTIKPTTTTSESNEPRKSKDKELEDILNQLSKAENDADQFEKITSRLGEGWVAIKLTDEEAKKVEDEMDIRIRNAQREASQLGNDDDDDEYSEYDLDDDIDEFLGTRKPNKAAKKSILPSSKELELRRIRGFLEINPFVCSGCGTMFQTKQEDNPGYLPKDKFDEHRTKAELIRQQQDAIKVLELADIELTSPVAETFLRSANIPENVIAGVKAFGLKISGFTDTDQSQSVNDIEDFTTINGNNKMKPSKRLEEERLLQDRKSNVINDLDPETNENRALVTFKKKNNNKKIISSISRTEQMLRNAGINPIDSPEDRETDSEGNSIQVIDNVDNLAEEICICQRCFRLQQYGQVDQSLRPGWSSHELLTPERFESLLGNIKQTETIVLAIIDIFDVQGSVLKNLKEIAGKNPVMIAVNKIDLLPKDISTNRVTSWVYQQVKSICRFRSPLDSHDEYQPGRKKYSRNVEESAGVLHRSNIHLISCQSGHGIDTLMESLLETAPSHGNTVHVLGAANVGKSSFINRIIDPKSSSSTGSKNQKNMKNKKKNKTPLVTVSNLPGTTLDFLKIKLPTGLTMVDTPGLLSRGHLTSKLTTEELKEVIPSKPINAVTLRLEEGKAVLIGGFAKIELIEGRAFFFTFFIANDIKLHATDSERSDAFLEKHIGKLIFPPKSKERLDELGPYVSQEFEIEGKNWSEATTDVVMAGLGWVAITGPGRVRVRVTTPEDTIVCTRPALLPYEAKHTTASYTGGKITKKSGKGSSGGKGYGWRA